MVDSKLLGQTNPEHQEQSNHATTDASSSYFVTMQRRRVNVVAPAVRGEPEPWRRLLSGKHDVAHVSSCQSDSDLKESLG